MTLRPGKRGSFWERVTCTSFWFIYDLSDTLPHLPNRSILSFRIHEAEAIWTQAKEQNSAKVYGLLDTFQACFADRIIPSQASTWSLATMKEQQSRSVCPSMRTTLWCLSGCLLKHPGEGTFSFLLLLWFQLFSHLSCFSDKWQICECSMHDECFI